MVGVRCVLFLDVPSKGPPIHAFLQTSNYCRTSIFSDVVLGIAYAMHLYHGNPHTHEPKMKRTQRLNYESPVALVKLYFSRVLGNTVFIREWSCLEEKDA
jgi:hypothetical protein